MINREDSELSIRTNSLSYQSKPPKSHRIHRPMSSVFNKKLLNSSLSNNNNHTTTTQIEQYTTVNSKRSRDRDQIEKERLFEETIQLKIIINNLKKELSEIIHNNIIMDSQLSQRDNEIQSLIKDSDIAENKNNNNSLLHKAKHHYKTLQKEYRNEVRLGELIQHNIKWTKANEMTIENDIMEKHLKQVSELYNNASFTNDLNNAKLKEYGQIKANVSNQVIILNSLKDDYAKSIALEQHLTSSIEETKGKLIEYTNRINKVNQENEMLSKENQLSLTERKRPYSSMQYRQSNTMYNTKIKELENQLKYYKSNNRRLSKVILQLKTKGLDKQRDPLAKSNNGNMANDLIKIECLNNNKETRINMIEKLKVTLEESKTQEDALEKEVKVYQGKINSLISIINENNGLNSNDQVNINLNEDNPYYTCNEDTDPIQTKKMTSSQYNQFTYILYKTFESKGINRSIAEEKIIKPSIASITDTNNDSEDTFDLIVFKLSTAILSLLHNNNYQDGLTLQVYLSALICNHNCDIAKALESFLHLFSYLQQYTPEIEKRLRYKITSKHKTKFAKLRNEIGNEHSNDYISLLEMKTLLEHHSSYIKDKYIEYLFYKMKQFDDDNQAALFDLKISNFDDLLESIALSESVQEISQKDYEKYIKDSLNMIISAIDKMNKSFKEAVGDCIAKISIPESSGLCNVISIESLNKRLKEMNVRLTDLQLSCLCTKYGMNNEVIALNVDEIDKDIKKIQNTLANYYEIEEEYEDVEDTQKDLVDFNMTNENMNMNHLTQ